MTAPRGLTADERAAWDRLAATVTPIRPIKHPVRATTAADHHLAETPRRELMAARPAVPLPPHHAMPGAQRTHPPAKVPERGPGLDSHWDRKFQAGRIDPDFTLDLHGHTLDSAHARLDDGLMQAKAMGARVVLLIAGKPRPVEAADRGTRRGAIRAKVLDWLALGPHGGDIAAIRKAHRRHGGEGALYLILRRPR